MQFNGIDVFAWLLIGVGFTSIIGCLFGARRKS